MLEYKPDFERSKERIAAFWEREIIDRPVVQFTLHKPADAWVPVPESHHGTAEERWLDTDFQVESACARLANQEFVADTLPIAFPNLGPEFFSALYGCPLHFGDYGTSWTDPVLHDWSDFDSLSLDWESPLLTKLTEMTDALLDAGKDKFIVGMTDWHPGGDHLAALRDPAQLAMDMVTNRDDVVRALAQTEKDYYAIYDHFYHKLRDAGQPITTWLPLMSDGRYYVPSNDFSIMVSRAMYDDVFLPGIANECRFLDQSIYHLDGPGALRHLDSILSIDELDALQWVPGAGNEGFSRWVDVYQRAQQAGKGIQVYCEVADLDLVMDTLKPEGLSISISDVPSREIGEELMARLERWCARRVRFGQ